MGKPTGLFALQSSGASYRTPLLEGVDLETLEKGFGHFPTSAQVGEVGNLLSPLTA